MLRLDSGNADNASYPCPGNGHSGNRGYGGHSGNNHSGGNHSGSNHSGGNPSGGNPSGGNHSGDHSGNRGHSGRNSLHCQLTAITVVQTRCGPVVAIRSPILDYSVHEAATPYKIHFTCPLNTIYGTRTEYNHKKHEIQTLTS